MTIYWSLQTEQLFFLDIFFTIMTIYWSLQTEQLFFLDIFFTIIR